MEIEQDTLVEIVVSVGAVGLFVAIIVAIGLTFGQEGHLDDEGGLALIGAIAMFIVLMTGIGYWLSGRET